jgi:Na+/proline symporter
MVKKRTHLTGFFIGMVVGMDCGLFWHDFSFLNPYRVLTILDMPVFSGLILGLLLGVLGNFIEKTFYRQKRQSKLQKAE